MTQKSFGSISIMMEFFFTIGQDSETPRLNKASPLTVTAHTYTGESVPDFPGAYNPFSILTFELFKFYKFYLRIKIRRVILYSPILAKDHEWSIDIA